jgi:hypothetical protein
MFFSSRNNLHNHGIYICWINKLYSAFSETHIEAQLSNFIIHKQKSVQNNGVRKATVTRISNKSTTGAPNDE